MNAKWLLEYELAQVRAKRAPKPIEPTSSAKRKHDEINDPSTLTEETPAKKPKNEESEEADHLFTLDGILKDMETENASTEQDGEQPVLDAAPAISETEKPATSEKAPEPIPTTEQPSKPVPDSTSHESEDKKEDGQEQQPQMDVQASIQDPKSATDQNMDFESMFDTLGDNNDINFDDLDNLDNNNTFDMAINDSQNLRNNSEGANSLNNLLPSLESYGDSREEAANAISTSAGKNNVPASTNAFDLPEMGETATFDDFFGDAMGNGTGEAKDDDILNDDSMLDLGTFDDNWLMES